MPSDLTVRTCIPLNFSAEGIRRGKRNLRIDAFVIDKASKVVVNNAIAVPTVEHFGFKEFVLFVVPDLIVGNDNGVLS